MSAPTQEEQTERTNIPFLRGLHRDIKSVCVRRGIKILTAADEMGALWLKKQKDTNANARNR